ncbi:hypothetical protein J6524_04990 [Bradyrhizobium sp. WSM 1738]|uniref:hypothetical protein n=1 Tax=Bradyrhizobium hereditatis TaxID=2821405 RepID=UPI001CE25905|nr:hypothetical protein [Bradyrhizobium hereditatis]MCA6114285.1 hypothetical protein [Bradyrhizobium hereditatis]
MAIGNCDCCDRMNVPGHVVNCPGEPFACYICQGDDDADPYCEAEIEQPCPECKGDGGFEHFTGGYNHYNGEPHTRWSRCDACEGTGSVFEPACPAASLDDLSERCGDGAR